MALDAGYGSHEAFTRAFRNEFGITPDQFRTSPDEHLSKLTESFLMNAEKPIKLNKPTILDAPPMFFAGLGRRFEYDDMGAIPAQWQKFNEYAGTLTGEVSGAAYGVCTNADTTGLDYISAVEVRDLSDVPPELMRLRIPAQRYAVFAHDGHISEIRNVIQAAFGEGLPKEGWRWPTPHRLKNMARTSTRSAATAGTKSGYRSKLDVARKGVAPVETLGLPITLALTFGDLHLDAMSIRLAELEVDPGFAGSRRCEHTR